MVWSEAGLGLGLGGLVERMAKEKENGNHRVVSSASFDVSE